MCEGSKLSIGVIGAGSIANNIHMHSLSEIGNVKIAAVCDIVERKAESTAQRFMIPKWYSNYLQMLSNEALDAVFVLVPPDQNFRVTLDCINYGLDVFVEKPAGITAYQTESLAKRAAEAGRLVQVGFNRRYIPLVKEVVKVINEATTITQVEGCFFKNSSAQFYNGCASSYECDVIHAIDLVRWIAGGQPEAAATLVGQYNSPVPNSWNSLIRFNNGVTGIIKSNYQTGGRVHTFEIHGYTASAYINLGFGVPACEADIIFFGGRQSYSISAIGAGTVEIVHYDGKKLSGSDEYYKYYGYFDEVCQFIESIQTREAPIANLNESVKTMQLADMMARNKI